MKQKTLLSEVTSSFVIGAVGYGCWYVFTSNEDPHWIAVGIVKSLLCGLAAGCSEVIMWLLFSSGSQHFKDKEERRTTSPNPSGKAADQRWDADKQNTA
jgi:hypothetical protein